MSAPIVAFFNGKGGVGTTSLVYHLTWMFAEKGQTVVAADLDPQADLSAAFLDEERLEELWPDGPHHETVFGSIEPMLRGTGDVSPPHAEPVADHISLLVGDLALSNLEDGLSAQWPGGLDGNGPALRAITAFWRTVEVASRERGAHITLLDVGPNLGAINRAALVAADYVVIALSPDLSSAQGLRNLGPTLRRWRAEWKGRVLENPGGDIELPAGSMEPLGYVVQKPGVRLDRPASSYGRWMARIPDEYGSAVMGTKVGRDLLVESDPQCLALLEHYHGLLPMAMEARKPLFLLRPADGAIGAHMSGVTRAYRDFDGLARRIDERIAALAGRVPS